MDYSGLRGNKQEFTSDIEWDALRKHSRPFYRWKSGKLKKIKRAYNKRFRKAGKPNGS